MQMLVAKEEGGSFQVNQTHEQHLTACDKEGPRFTSRATSRWCATSLASKELNQLSLMDVAIEALLHRC